MSPRSALCAAVAKRDTSNTNDKLEKLHRFWNRLSGDGPTYIPGGTKETVFHEMSWKTVGKTRKCPCFSPRSNIVLGNIIQKKNLRKHTYK